MKLGKFTLATSFSVFVVLLVGACSNLSTSHSASEEQPVASAAYPMVTAQKPNNYTIQIAIGEDAQRLQQTMSNGPVNCELFKFKIKQGKKDNESVITCGSFSSLEEANSVMLTLPVEMNTNTAGIYQWKALQKRVAND